MESKYIGKTYEGFKVINYYRKNEYRKIYKNPKRKTHSSYNYELYNETTKQHLTLSGNQLRLINNGRRTINQMLTSTARRSRNPQIHAYLKWKRSSK